MAYWDEGLAVRPRANRRLGMCLRAAILLAAALALWAPVAGAAQSPGGSDPEECTASPTARCVAALAAATAEAIPDPYVRARAFVHVAGAQRAAGDAGGARESLSRALSAAAVIESPSNAAALSSAPLCRPTNSRRKHPEVLALRARTLIAVATEQLAGGDGARARRILSDAMATAEAIEDPYSRARVLCDIAAIRKMAGEDDRAREALSQALAVTDRVESRASRTGLLIAIAEMNVSAGKLRAAADILRTTRRIAARSGADGDRPSKFDLERIAAVQAAAGDIEGAIVTARTIGDEADFIRARTLADIAHARAAEGDAAGAFSVERAVKGAYLRIFVVARVGLALARAGDIAGAGRAAARIAEINEEESRDPAYTEAAIHRSAIFEAIVGAHIAAGALDKASDALGEIERGYRIADAAVALARARMVAGEFDAALTTAGTVCKFRHRNDRCAEVLADLASSLAVAGNIRRARALLSLARDEAERTRFASERIRSFASLWQAGMRMGDREGARKAFAAALAAARGIDDVPKRVDELTALGVAAAREGEHDRAGRAFSSAIAAVDEFRDSVGGTGPDIIGRRAHAYARIGREQVRAGDVEGARDSISRALVAADRAGKHDAHVAFLVDVASVLASGWQRMR